MQAFTRPLTPSTTGRGTAGSWGPTSRSTLRSNAQRCASRRRAIPRPQGFRAAGCEPTSGTTSRAIRGRTCACSRRSTNRATRPGPARWGPIIRSRGPTRSRAAEPGTPAAATPRSRMPSRCSGGTSWAGSATPPVSRRPRSVRPASRFAARRVRVTLRYSTCRPCRGRLVVSGSASKPLTLVDGTGTATSSVLPRGRRKVMVVVEDPLTGLRATTSRAVVVR